VTGPQSARFDASPARSCYPWILGILALLIPFVFAPALADPFELPKWVLLRLGVLVLIGFGWWQLRLRGEAKISRSRAAVPLLLLAFIALLSIFQAANRSAATAAARDATLLSILFVLAASVLPPAREGILCGCLGLATGATALLGTLQLLAGPRVTWLPATQGGALVGDVAAAALLVAAGLPVLLGLAFSTPASFRWAWSAGAGSAIGFVALARSTAAWLGALAALALFAILRRAEIRRVRSESRPPASSRGLLVLITVLALTIVLAGTRGAGISLLSNPPSLRTSDLLGWELRWDSWRTSLDLLLTHPLGSGAGNWKEAFTARVGNLTPASQFTSGRLPLQAGSEYLQVGAELGAVGLFLLLWALYRLLREGIAASRAGGGWVVISATAGIGGLAAASLLASPLRDPATLWTAALLAILVTAARPIRLDAEHPPSSRWRFPALGRNLRTSIVVSSGALILVLIGLTGWSSFEVLSASASLKIGQAAFGQAEYRTALPALRRARELDPSSHLSRYLLGACAGNLGQRDLAEKELRAARSMNPGDAFTLLALASTLRGEGKLIDAVAVIEKAVHFWPHDEAVNLRAGDLREATGNRREAFAAYTAAVGANPSSVKAYIRLGDLQLARGNTFNSVTAYLKAANLDPFDPEAVGSLATAYVKGGDYQSAVQVYQSLLILAPEDVHAMLDLARTYSGLGRNCDAVSMLRRAQGIAKDPGELTAIAAGIQAQSAKCGNNPGRTGP
jgi:tetratricopeptide (TPR) repeat protein